MTPPKIVTATRDLQKQASARRKQVLTQALADRMGVSPEDHRVRRAVTMWSAIVAGAYTRPPRGAARLRSAA
jgi:hypothetical protein